MASLGFGELADRLVRYLNELVQRGEVSERGLAKLSGYSQPHIHNVLHGARALKISMADRLLETLGIPLSALFTSDELDGSAPAEPTQAQPAPILQGLLGAGELFPKDGAQPAPILQGLLGAGELFPKDGAHPALYFLPPRTLEGLVNPALAQVSGNERAAWPSIWPRDLVLLDRSPHLRRKPTIESFYALEWENRGYICRCRRMGGTLLTITDSPSPSEPPARIEIDSGELLQAIRGLIVWVGRDLRRQ